jgi:IS5 family transposase
VKEGPVSERDPEAGWTKKNGKSHFGYKAHVAVDEGSEIIRTLARTLRRRPPGGPWCAPAAY